MDMEPTIKALFAECSTIRDCVGRIETRLTEIGSKADDGLIRGDGPKTKADEVRERDAKMKEQLRASIEALRNHG